MLCWSRRREVELRSCGGGGFVLGLAAPSGRRTDGAGSWRATAAGVLALVAAEGSGWPAFSVGPGLRGEDAGAAAPDRWRLARSRPGRIGAVGVAPGRVAGMWWPCCTSGCGFVFQSEERMPGWRPRVWSARRRCGVRCHGGCGLRCWWSGRSSGRFARFATHRRAKALPWLSARADDGDALGRRVLLEGVIEVVLLPLHAGFSGGNPRSLAGSGEGGAPASLASWGLALDVPPARGTSGFRWWLAAASLRLRLGGARQSDRCGCRSGGSGFSSCVEIVSAVLGVGYGR